MKTSPGWVIFFLGLGLIVIAGVFVLVKIIDGTDLTVYQFLRTDQISEANSEVPTATSTPETFYHPVRVPVLMYHYIRTVDRGSDPLGFSLSVTPADFEQQLQYLKTEGYTSITPAELYEALSGSGTLPAKPVLLTFDDGYEDFYTAAYPLLQKYGDKATIFVITGFLSASDGRYLTWQQLRDLGNSGMITIGAHTVHHKDLVVTPDPWAEIHDSQTTLENFLGHPVTAFAYPSGVYNAHVIDLVQKSGFDLGFTTGFGINHTLAARLVTSRVRISGGLGMEKFVDRLNGRISAVAKKPVAATP